MKKIILFILIVLCLGLSSCKEEPEHNVDIPAEVNIYMPDGTPALALASVLDEGFSYNEAQTNFHIVTAADIAATVSRDTCDMAIMPTTAAATLYKKGIALQLASVNVFGNLFITGTKKTTSLEDLKGKIVYTTAATTIQMLQYILENNHIEYEIDVAEAVTGKVAISTCADGTEIITRLAQAVKQGVELYGVLGEPQVTNAQKKIEGLNINVDFQKEYKKITGFDGYPQACLIVKKAFAERYSSYVNAFLAKLEGNEAYLKEHLDDLPNVLAKYDSSLASMNFTLDTITRCNLRLEKSSSVKASVIGYINELMDYTLADEFFL